MLSAITVVELLQQSKMLGSATFRYTEPLTLVGAVPGVEPAGGLGRARAGNPPATPWRKTMSASVNIRGLRKRYGDLEVLKGIDLRSRPARPWP